MFERPFPFIHQRQRARAPRASAVKAARRAPPERREAAAAGEASGLEAGARPRISPTHSKPWCWLLSSWKDCLNPKATVPKRAG